MWYNTQTNTYDKLNRVTSSKNANNEIIRNTYDSLGNIKKQTITDSSGTQSILYQRSYDGDGKLVSDTDNAGNSNLYVYDDMGRLHISQDKASKQNSYGYNELGTLDSASSANPGDSIIARNYAFKNPFGANTVFDVRGIYDDSVGQYQAYINEITQYTYTPTGNLMEQYGRYAIDTGMDDVDFNPYVYYQYDSTGNITLALHGIVDNVNETIWGATTHYEYDKNRLSKVQIDGEDIRNTADSVNVLYEYYDDGKLKSVTYPALTDGSILKSEYVYDGLSRLTSLTNYKGTEVLSSYAYTYDSNGNILTTTENVGTTQNSIAYTYDKLNRIATVAGTKGADSYYEYDARGNRKANFEQIDFLSEESAIFIYDAEDHLDRSQVGDDVTFFEYAANGYRYFKQENLDYPEYYVYDPDGRLQAIAAALTLRFTDGTTTNVMFPITHYIWGLDRVLAKIDKTTNRSYYYLYNGHGDVVQIVGTAGNIKNTYDYDVWGNFLKKEETIENHFTYFGQTYDETTGLYYLRARYYDPTTGRFTQQDSAEDGYNWYVYGANNPITYIDRSGEAIETIVDVVNIGISLKDLISNPSWANLGFLAWDVGATILPAIPGSYTYKGAKLVKGVSGLGKFTKGNFRKNLTKLIGDAPSWMKKAEAHHVLPQKFSKWFADRGLNIHDPRFGSWVDKASHNKWSYEYNERWKNYIKNNPNASAEKVVEYAKSLAKEFGFNINY